MMHRFALALIWSLGVSLASARAHFIWIAAGPANGDRSMAQCRVYFSELPEPGQPRLIGKIAHTKAWVRGAGGETSELKLARADTDAAALVATCAKYPAASFEAACDYGVYERGGPAVLLQYYAKHLAGDWTGRAQLVRAERLALDIVPALGEGRLQLQVLYKGNPAAESEVVAIDPSGKEHELKADSQGRAALPASAGGWAIRAARIEPERGGERSGKPYRQTWHYCTLTLHLPADAGARSAELPAAKLLEEARAARAVWNDFPGFSADLMVSGPGGEVAAKMTINGDGEVALDMPASPLAEWVRQQLESLVPHRMPSGEISEGDVIYADDAAAHPLGRKIELGDSEGSAYRIKGDVITEVNRSAGKLRFTISVLEIVRNAENKYLPRSFTMSFFDAASGELKTSLGYSNQWRRVGTFDLPSTILETRATNGGTTTRQIIFENWCLLKSKTNANAGDVQPISGVE